MGEKIVKSRKARARQQLETAKFLSIPKYRRRKYKKPKVKLNSGVKKAALRGKCTSLISLLAKPKTRKLPGIQDPADDEAWKPVLPEKPSPWQLESSLPKLQHVSVTKKHFEKQLPQRQSEAIRNLHQKLIEKYKENHPPHGETNELLLFDALVHKKCVRDLTDKTERYICQLSMKQRREFQRRMFVLAQAKAPPPPPVSRGGKKKLSDLLPTLEKLSKPNKKESQTPREPFKVKPRALKAICTDYVAILAEPKKEMPPAKFYDFRGKEITKPREWKIEERRRVITSERTEALAIPKITKKKAEEDTKEDPFKVNPAALKFQCTQRLAELAVSKKSKKRKKRVRTSEY